MVRKDLIMPGERMILCCFIVCFSGCIIHRDAVKAFSVTLATTTVCDGDLILVSHQNPKKGGASKVYEGPIMRQPAEIFHMWEPWKEAPKYKISLMQKGAEVATIIINSPVPRHVELEAFPMKNHCLLRKQY